MPSMKPPEPELKIRNEYKPWLVSAILAIFDFLAITLSYALAYEIRVWLIPWLGGPVVLSNLRSIYWITTLFILGLFFIHKMYPGVERTGIIELREVLTNVSIAYITLGLAIFIFGYGDKISRFIYFLSWLFTFFFISGFRVILHNRGSLLSWWSEPVLIVGAGEDIENVITKLLRARRMALKPIAALDFTQSEPISFIHQVPSYPFTDSRTAEIRRCGIRKVFYVSQSYELNQKNSRHIYQLSLLFPELIYVMQESPLSSLSTRAIDIEGQPALVAKYNLLDPFAKAMKRLFDLLLCILTLMITLPLFLIIALLIKLDSPGGIIFTQKRMGQNGKIFEIYKFRTMESDAEEKLEILLQQNQDLREEYERYHKLQRDPRITRVGQVIRKLSLDELPQIFNVIKGEMSLVGPRAYLPQEKHQMGNAAVLIHRVRPGLTGWWQVMGRHDVSFEERLKLDQYYISNFSLWMDFYIVLKTIWIILSGKGA